MLTDLNQILKAFDEHALGQLYVQAFEKAFLEGAFDAIPGKESTVQIKKTKLEFTSYAILNDEKFQKWHEAALKRIQEPDLNQVASTATYGHLTKEQFRLLAERARAAKAGPAATSDNKAAKTGKKSGKVTPTAPTGPKPQTGTQGAAAPATPTDPQAGQDSAPAGPGDVSATPSAQPAQELAAS